MEDEAGDSPVVAAAATALDSHLTKAALPILPCASWASAVFWQWSNCQKVAGINGCVDGDRFNGSTPASVTVTPTPGARRRWFLLRLSSHPQAAICRGFPGP